MSRVLSEAAQVAALLKKEAKRRGLKTVRVRSHYFAGGNSVDVTLDRDTDPDKYHEFRLWADQFKSGDFDGMTDCYNYRRGCTGPTAKFVSVDLDWRNE